MFKKVLIALFIFIISAVAAIFIAFEVKSAKNYSVINFDMTEEMKTADLELGKRIYTVRSGCIDCHGTDLSGKMVMDNGAMGKIYGANLTADKLKSWSDNEIARAIRYGVHKTNRSLNFMPSFDYVALSKSDIAALVKYIRSSAPVSDTRHANSFGPIAKMLSVFGKMPVMFPADVIDLNQDFASKPEEKVSFEFGQYLSNSCIGCHGDKFIGGKIPGGDPSWPEAKNIRLGANPVWTKEVFSQYLKTGISPTTKEVSRAPMPIWLLKEFNEIESESLWLYLSSLK